MTTSPNIFEINNFSASYRDAEALNDVSLNIPRRGIMSIIGPSGCGKSTLLNSLNRITDLTPDFSHRGDVHFDGQNIYQRDFDVVNLRKNVGLIFQKPNPFPFSVYKNLSLPLKEHGMRNRKEIESTVNESMKIVGLLDEVSNIRRRNATELSGGQQQRLCIARTLTLKPKVLLCDEPCSALDPVSGKKIEDLLVRLGKEISVVVVTHNLAQAKRISDCVAFFCMVEGVGKLIEKGDTQKIFNAAQHHMTREYVDGSFG
ncbi:phosphate ABC transporter ATP-binding protein [Pirellulaceae bacterium]|jgi:phosphate transport system ATP-binding protein|nr:phosphate ABC transporter ATP-binding protein [Pirellulaceae bacterium]